MSLISLSAARFQPAAFDPAPAIAAVSRLLPGHWAAGQYSGIRPPRVGDYFAVSGRAGHVRVRTAPARRRCSPASTGTSSTWRRSTSGGPATAEAAAARTLPAPDRRPAGVERAAPVRPQRHQRRLLRRLPRLGRVRAADRRARPARHQRGASSRWAPTPSTTRRSRSSATPGRRCGPGSPVRRTSRGGCCRTCPASAVRCPGGSSGPRRPRHAGSRPAARAGHDPGAARLLRHRAAGLRGPEPRRRARGPAGHLGRLQAARLAGPAHRGLRRVAAAFYRAPDASCSATRTMYKMDLLHEGGNPGDVPVGEAARARDERAADRPSRCRSGRCSAGRTTRRRRSLDAVDRSQAVHRRRAVRPLHGHGPGERLARHAVRLRQHLELRRPHHDRRQHPVWGSGSTSGATSPAARSRASPMPEGTDNNPAAFELFTELAWRTAPVDQSAWFAAYAVRRYGGDDPHAAAAWDAAAHGPVQHAVRHWSESQDSLFTARPGSTATTAAGWSPGAMRYDPATVRRGAGRAAAGRAGAAGDPTPTATTWWTSPVRRWPTAAGPCSRRSGRPTTPRTCPASVRWPRSGRATWRCWTGCWPPTSASCSARGCGMPRQPAWSSTPVRSSRSGGRATAARTALHDYANRELVGPGLRLLRAALDQVSRQPRNVPGQPAAPRPIDWFPIEDGWARETKTYPITTAGDPYLLAAEVAKVVGTD